MPSHASNLPHGILFDMDGLMLRSEELWDEVDKLVAQHYGRAFDLSLKPLFMGCEKIESARRFREAYGIQDSAEIVAEKRGQLACRFYREGAELMPGLRDLVEDLKDWGKPLAVATSADRAIVSIVVARFDVFGAFDAIVCADDVRNGKPAPDLFLEAAARLHLAASACVVLEDSPNGVAAGLSAGAKVIGVPNPAIAPERMNTAHVLVPRLKDISRELMRGLFA